MSNYKKSYTERLTPQGQLEFTTWKCWRGGERGKGYKSFKTEREALEYCIKTDVARIDLVVTTVRHYNKDKSIKPVEGKCGEKGVHEEHLHTSKTLGTYICKGVE